LRPARLVVFDLDGTLVDSSQDLAAAVNEALAGIAPLGPRLRLSEVRSFVGSGAQVLMARSLARAGIAKPVDEVLPLFLECYRRRLLHRTRLYPGVEEGLQALAGRTLAVLTNKPGEMSREILAGLGVAERFAHILGGDEVPARKPDPEGLRRLIAETGVAADETVMVGDSAIDVRTGRAAGARTVGVTYGFDPDGLSQDPPDFVVDDLRRLPALLVGVRPTVLT